MSYDTIVIGLGAMSSAATYQLAQRGANVLGIDDLVLEGTTSFGHRLPVHRSLHATPRVTPDVFSTGLKGGAIVGPALTGVG